MQILDAELPADRFSEAGGEIREEPGEIRLEVGDLLRRERIAMQQSTPRLMPSPRWI